MLLYRQGINLSNIKIFTLCVLASLLIVFPLVTGPYTIQVTFMTITYSMLGLAFSFSMRVGLPRIDIGAWWSIGGYITALMMRSGINFWLAALVGGLVAVVLGWLLFSIILPRGMLTLFIFCLIGLIGTPQLLQYLTSVPFFRGTSGILPPATIGPFQIVTQRDLFYLGLFFLGFNLTVFFLLYNSRVGKTWDAIGSNLKLARSVGVNIFKYRMANLLIGNFFIAMAGSYFIAHYRAQMMLSFSLQSSVLIMIYPIIGGISHSLAGPIIGAIVAAFIPSYYLSFAQQYQIIISSGIGILILMFFPQGILGLIDQVVRRYFGQWRWYIRIMKYGVKEREI